MSLLAKLAVVLLFLLRHCLNHNSLGRLQSVRGLMKSISSVSSVPEPHPPKTRLTKRMPPRHTTFVAPWLLAVASAHTFAQTHHIAPPEKVTRAIGVYEWTGDLSKPKASRLVPISLFINGHFEDAGLYMARPVPFALESGDIYSVELAGEEKGTFSLEHAADFTTGRLLPDQDPVGAWYGFGRFAPLAPPKPPPALHASAHPPVIVSSSPDSDSGRPHLTSKSDSAPKRSGDTGANDSSTKDPNAKGTSTTDTDSASGKTPMGDDPDRPTLGRRTSSDSDSKSSDSTGSGSASSGSASSDGGSSGGGSKPSSDNDPERPSLRKRNPENTGKKSPPTAGVTGPDRPLNDDPDRPIIRHGKKPEAEEDSELKTLPPDMHQAAAVSDPNRREPHVFARAWESNAERADVLGKLQALARAQVSAYLAQNHLTPGLTPIPATPGTAGAGAAGTPETSAPDKNAPVLRRTPGGVNTSSPAASATGTAKAAPATATPKAAPTAKPGTTTAKAHPATAAHTAATHTAKGKAPKPVAPAPLLLDGEQLTGYTLSYGGLPTFVYTAQIPTAEGPPVYVTLAAQRLPSGEMQLALHSVTDANHLDRTPWMRPVDAVDPDASHRASLLFELRAHSSRQFALYRLISAQAEQQFVSGAIE